MKVICKAADDQNCVEFGDIEKLREKLITTINTPR